MANPCGRVHGDAAAVRFPPVKAVLRHAALLCQPCPQLAPCLTASMAAPGEETHLLLRNLMKQLCSWLGVAHRYRLLYVVARALAGLWRETLTVLRLVLCSENVDRVSSVLVQLCLGKYGVLLFAEDPATLQAAGSLLATLCRVDTTCADVLLRLRLILGGDVSSSLVPDLADQVLAARPRTAGVVLQLLLVVLSWRVSTGSDAGGKFALTSSTADKMDAFCRLVWGSNAEPTSALPLFDNAWDKPGRLSNALLSLVDLVSLQCRDGDASEQQSVRRDFARTMGQLWTTNSSPSVKRQWAMRDFGAPPLNVLPRLYPAGTLPAATSAAPDVEETKAAVAESDSKEDAATPQPYTIAVFESGVVEGLRAEVKVPQGWKVISGGGRVLVDDSTIQPRSLLHSTAKDSAKPIFQCVNYKVCCAVVSRILTYWSACTVIRYLLTASYPSSLHAWAVSFVRREAISHFVDGADDLNTARCIFSTSTTPKLVRAARGVAMQHSWQQTDVYLVSWVQGVHDQPAAQCTALAVAIYDPHDALDLTISTRTARADTTRWVASAHANVHAPEG